MCPAPNNKWPCYKTLTENNGLCFTTTSETRVYYYTSHTWLAFVYRLSIEFNLYKLINRSNYVKYRPICKFIICVIM